MTERARALAACEITCVDRCRRTGAKFFQTTSAKLIDVATERGHSRFPVNGLARTARGEAICAVPAISVRIGPIAAPKSADECRMNGRGQGLAVIRLLAKIAKI